MPPALQHYPALEWLSFGGDHDTIVLAPRARIIFAPVQLEAGEPQFIERDEQVLRPLVTVAAFPEAVIKKEIIENWRAKHPVLSPELAYSGISALCQQRCLIPIHPWRKGRELVGQRLGLGRIIFGHLECNRLLLLISDSRPDPSRKDYEDNSKTSQ